MTEADLVHAYEAARRAYAGYRMGRYALGIYFDPCHGGAVEPLTWPEALDRREIQQLAAALAVAEAELADWIEDFGEVWLGHSLYLVGPDGGVAKRWDAGEEVAWN